MEPRIKRLVKKATLSLAVLSLLAVGGCVALGAMLSKLPPMPVSPPYKGMPGQSIGVMVWADRMIRIDFTYAQLDLANSMQAYMKSQQTNKNRSELKGSTFPVEPRSILRYQVEHPEVEAMAITEVGPKLQVSRLMYVEITELQTRPDMGLELFRGVCTARLTIVEIDDNLLAKVVYTEDEIRVTVPEKGPVEGQPGTTDDAVYRLTMAKMAEEVVHRVITYTPAE